MFADNNPAKIAEFKNVEDNKNFRLEKKTIQKSSVFENDNTTKILHLGNNNPTKFGFQIVDISNSNLPIGSGNKVKLTQLI